MDQLINLWMALNLRRRVIIIVSTLAMFAAVVSLSRLATTPGESLLFSGLDGAAAGEVVAALEQRGVLYSVRGSSIYVSSAKRDELRMSLAAEGMPATGLAGYEILDSLSGFGTTSQMFDTAYWRAMEGELARTILASPQIRTARVHIGRSMQNSLRKQEPRTASVTVSGASGAISGAQAKALQFLVGSAVSGLSPENVSVIDGQTGAIFAGDAADHGAQSNDELAIRLKRNVERLLEARVGPGNAVVEVAVEFETESETISERTFDPDSRVAISIETEENTLDATEPSPGVTVASNLPTGDVNGGAAGRSQNNQTRERTNYEVSETQREVLRASGAVRRITVAVLVNSVQVANGNGDVVEQPREADELENLRGLVSAAVGYDETRGDAITIHSMPFEPQIPLGTPAEIGLFDRLDLDVMMIIQLLILAVVALALAFGIVRPLLTKALEASAIPPSLPAPDGNDIPTLTGEIADATAPEFATDIGLAAPVEFQANEASDLQEITGDPVERLKQLIEDRQGETVEILRGWMEKDGENA